MIELNSHPFALLSKPGRFFSAPVRCGPVSKGFVSVLFVVSGICCIFFDIDFVCSFMSYYVLIK